MEVYTDFASVYDSFMEELPYGQWADYVQSVLREHGIQEGLLLDLACGTGLMAELMSERGFEVIGVDCSGEMLEIAAAKKQASGRDILYLQQDMRSFELYGTVKAVICMCDSMNYMMSVEDLLSVFELVNNYLDPRGLFIFDMKTCYMYEQVLADGVFAQNAQMGSYIWDNTYDPVTRINEYELTVYLQEQDGRYCRHTELHCQRGYDWKTVQRLLEQSGLLFVGVYDADTLEAAEETSERVYFVAQEQEKDASGACPKR